MPDGDHAWRIGTGEYPLGEAVRLTGVSRRRARHWLFVGTEPVLIPQLPSLNGERPVGFLNLIEMALIRELREAGVTWPTIRKLIGRARSELSEPHPFAVSRIHTDGRGAFMETARETGDPRLLDLVSGNFAMLKILEGSFTRTVTYEAGRAARWRPDERTPRIVLDPNRSFGRPIDDETGVLSATLADALRAENGDAQRVASWWNVPVDAVRQAAEFEVRHPVPMAA